MTRRRFTREFKLEAVRLVREQNLPATQTVRDLDLHENVLRKWIWDFRDDPAHTLRGHRQVKPEQNMVATLKREIKKLKAERDILKNRGLVHKRIQLRYVFIAKYRRILPIMWICEVLDVSPSVISASSTGRRLDVK